MKIRKLAALLFVICSMLTAFHPSYAQSKKTLTIFAASSLTDAFGEMKTAFEKAHTDVDIAFSFDASSALAAQLKEGAPADVFASANASQMNVAITAKRIAGAPRTFAKNRLVLVVPVDNPGKITSLKDLAKPGLKLIVAKPAVPVRDYTDTMLKKLATTPGYGPDYQAAVIKNFIEQDNVRQVSAQVALGNGDAGTMYRSDVTPDIASKVTVLPIPDAVNTIATYPIAVTNDSANPDLAKAFVDYVLSDAGQETLVKWNFISSRIPPVPATITLPTDGALHVGGQVLNPLKLTVDDLKANYTAQKADVSYLNGDQTVKASFSGVYLRDILDAAQVNLNADVKNDKLGMSIVATGSDGYQAVIAWGEIDPDFGNVPILVAYEQDGKPISDAGGTIRLVVPTDRHGGRYVSGLVSLEVRDAPTVSK